LVPEDFLIGVATSGYQIEGGFNGPGEPANNWARWEEIGRVEPSGIACDFWREPEATLDRAASLGCNAFRLSVEWARLEPSPEDFDDTALDRYAAILAMCEERGMAPVVTLHHFTHPWWLGPEFWLTPGSPDRFAAHVARLLPRLAPHCSRWVTFNEPNIVALTGWVAGACPPGRRGALSDAWAVVDNLMTAHVLAHREIHRVQPGAQVTVNTSASSLYDYDRLLTDLLVAPSLGIGADDLDDWVDERRALHYGLLPAGTGAGAVAERALRSALTATSPFGHAGRHRRPSPRRVVAEAYQDPGEGLLDFAGFDWYDPIAGQSVQLPGHRTAGGRSWDPARAIWDTPADPAGLTAWCAAQSRFTPDMPLWVVENGLCNRVRRGRAYPRTDGWDRPRYLRAHLGAVVDALEQGSPVTAYLHWSLVDNYEWGSYEPRFGIFGIDRERGTDGGRGVRWLETDAAGDDAAGAFRRLVAGLRSGDRSVLAVAP
jgi:beta-glucosidase/6-phospho-beta-glucosidase/beta-galactosidase